MPRGPSPWGSELGMVGAKLASSSPAGVRSGPGSLLHSRPPRPSELRGLTRRRTHQPGCGTQMPPGAESPQLRTTDLQPHDWVPGPGLGAAQLWQSEARVLVKCQGTP